MSKYSAANLLDLIGNKNNPEISQFILTYTQNKQPFYLQGLVAIGTISAALFFIAFLVLLNIIGSNYLVDIICATFLIMLAITTNHLHTKDCHSLTDCFLKQLSFTFMIVGKLLLTYAITAITASNWSPVITLLILTLLTYPIYRVLIDQFLSSFAVLQSILWTLLGNSANNEFLINLFFLFQLVTILFLFTNSKVKNYYTPIAYAFVFSICATLFILVMPSSFFYHIKVPLGFINTSLSLGLVYLFIWASSGIKNLKSETFILTSLGIIILGAISASGLLLCISIMIIGYAKHEKNLTTFAVLFLPAFLFFYYYNLDTSLMDKSIILIGSGIVLLIGKFYIQYKKLDQG